VRGVSWKESDDDVEDRQRDPCCASDGGRSSGVAVQAEIPNHRSVMSVKSRGGKRLRKRSASAVQVGDEKTNMCEPLLTYRKAC